MPGRAVSGPEDQPELEFEGLARDENAGMIYTDNFSAKYLQLYLRQCRDQMRKNPASESEYCWRETRYPSFLGFDATNAAWLDHCNKALKKDNLRGWISCLFDIEGIKPDATAFRVGRTMPGDMRVSRDLANRVRNTFPPWVEGWILWRSSRVYKKGQEEDAVVPPGWMTQYESGLSQSAWAALKAIEDKGDDTLREENDSEEEKDDGGG